MTPSTAKLLRAVVLHELSQGFFLAKGSIANQIGYYTRLVAMQMRPPDLPTKLLSQAPTDAQIEACVKECLAERAAAAFG